MQDSMIDASSISNARSGLENHSPHLGAALLSVLVSGVTM